MKVGIIDSGLGGISFSNNLDNKINDLEITLYIDKEGFPYGNKELLWLKERLETLVFDSKNNILIIACNTLSSIIFQYKMKFNKMVVDVITPTIYFLKEKNYKNICILATKNTIKMDVYSRLLETNITYVDASRLIDDLEKDNEYIPSLFEIIDNLGVDYDAILLGCTHLIKIKNEFRKYLNIDIVSQDEIFISLLK